MLTRSESKVEQIQSYLDKLCEALQNLPQEEIAEAIDVLEQARAEGRHIFLFGNGGSAATASHIAVDLLKGTTHPEKPRLKVMALNDGIPTLTAHANDFGYDTVFAGPLEALGEPGDVAIAISGSGNSPNVLRALDVARERGLTTIGLAGYAGGQLKDKADLCMIVPSDNMQRIEDAHLVILHMIFLALC